MTSPDPTAREKIASKLPERLRHELKVRAAEQRIDVQDAVHDAIVLWHRASETPKLDTSGSRSFGTWLPPGVWQGFEQECRRRGVSNIQGLTQAVHLWLQRPAPQRQEFGMQPPQRKIMANQKGGVGKTALSAGVAQAYAEGTEYGGPGKRVLVVDFDPQGHLSSQLAIPSLGLEGDSLVKHMTGEGTGELRELVAVVEDERFGDRLHVLPSCADGFVLDVKLSTVRAREAALERALEPLEEHYDIVIIDCPPSLGLAMDSAIYYGRTREGEQPGRSGVVIPVLAEDSSADAFTLLTGQIEDLREDMRIDVGYLGLVVNMYDGRRGYIATSSLENWQSLGEPPVIAVVPDRKEQREAVRSKQGLLAYEPKCDQSQIMREIAGRLA
ncbi:ParA family protein [Nocardiopsis dassonvillei]|uniref:ParA family protein n=1 Tax=Nocardiopsis dassonvillei TaxID=2014 RepID=UPI0033E49712